MISYLKAKKSLVRPDDVQWHVETKEWSKCSESCAGGTVPKFKSILQKKRPLDSRTRTTTTTRFDLKFFFAYSQNIDTLEFFIVLFSPEKLAMLSFLKEVKTSLDCKMRKHLTLDKLYPHYDILAKTRSRMTTATTFSRQNDAGSRVRTTQY